MYVIVSYRNDVPHKQINILQIIPEIIKKKSIPNQAK
jgi:hypothetical protein